MKTLIFKELYSLEMCPFLSALFIFLVGLRMTLFSEKMLIFNTCRYGLMPNLIKKSWTVSISGLWDLLRLISMPGMIDQDKNSAGICYLARFTTDIGYDIILVCCNFLRAISFNPHTHVQMIYRTRAIIDRSPFEAALVYNPQIFSFKKWRISIFST